MIFELSDYLNTINREYPQWYGWGRIDGNREVYSNLIVHSPDAIKPTEQECIDGVALLQSNWDAQEYARLRFVEYNKLNQFEMQFDDQRDGTATWIDAINEIKTRFPK